jgi:hypothetical protein
VSPTDNKRGRELVLLALSPFMAVIASPVRFARWLTQWGGWWGAHSRRRLMLVTLLAVSTLAWIGSRTARLDLRYQAAEAGRAEDAETSYIAPPAVLKVMGLGHQSLVADVLFLRANMYFVNHLFGDRIFEWLDVYLDAILTLDPDNPTVYEWASQAVKFGQLITNESLERSNEYSRRGIERFPDHWRFYFDIGFNYQIEWQPADDEERQAMRDKALPYFSIAAMLPNSRMDPNFLTEMHLQRNDVEMALFHAYNRYWEANEREKEALRGRIGRYESLAAAERLKAIEGRWKTTYSYLPMDLFELIGPEQTLAVPDDWAADSELGVTTDPNSNDEESG